MNSNTAKHAQRRSNAATKHHRLGPAHRSATSPARSLSPIKSPSRHPQRTLQASRHDSRQGRDWRNGVLAPTQEEIAAGAAAVRRAAASPTRTRGAGFGAQSSQLLLSRSRGSPTARPRPSTTDSARTDFIEVPRRGIHSSTGATTSHQRVSHAPSSQPQPCGIQRSRVVGLVAPQLWCALCRQVPREPLQAPCKHLMCTRGVEDRVTAAGRITCLQCAVACGTHELKPPTRVIARLLDELRVRCRLADSGCSHTGPLSSMDLHEHMCDFVVEECLNNGCTVVCTRLEMQDHAAVCGLARVACRKCNAHMTRSETGGHNCTRDMLRNAATAMQLVTSRFDELESRLEARMAAMATAVDTRLAAMTLKMERIHSMVSDRLSQSKERNEILAMHDEVLHIGAGFRVASHRGSWECPQPTPGVLAPPPEAFWTCCRQKVKASWCHYAADED